jgi:GNAT superfamily N-acetyltransferase
MLKLSKCSRDKFISSIDQTNPQDNFARTFVAKADMQEQWDYCIGAFDDTELMGAIITTISKRRPFVANLQLLHTFDKHRGKGAARVLCDDSLRNVKKKGALYFRVSSEIESVGFYEKIGFKFWGKQKSGCQLSIFRINGNTFAEGDYDYYDSMINYAIHKKGKGGCIEIFDIAKSQILDLQYFQEYN